MVRSFAIMAISGHLSEANLKAHLSSDQLNASCYILSGALSGSSSEFFQRCRQFG